jgi:putative DNA-invertase from lambdoid prophage Rac
MLRAGICAGVSKYGRQNLPWQVRAMRQYAKGRGWAVAVQVNEVGEGAGVRKLRERILDTVRRRDIDVVLVWGLDRWARSMTDLITTLKELNDCRVGFVSLADAIDIRTPSGRAMAGWLVVFARFEHEVSSERIHGGLVEARLKAKQLGRPKTASLKREQIRKLYRSGVIKADIARRLQIAGTTVYRVLQVESRRTGNY